MSKHSPPPFGANTSFSPGHIPGANQAARQDHTELGKRKDVLSPPVALVQEAPTFPSHKQASWLPGAAQPSALLRVTSQAIRNLQTLTPPS